MLPCAVLTSPLPYVGISGHVLDCCAIEAVAESASVDPIAMRGWPKKTHILLEGQSPPRVPAETDAAAK